MFIFSVWHIIYYAIVSVDFCKAEEQIFTDKDFEYNLEYKLPCVYIVVRVLGGHRQISDMIWFSLVSIFQ